MSGLSSVRAVFKSRKTQYGTNSALIILIMTAILVLMGAITTKHPKRYDLTENQRYSLSDESQKVLSGLDAEVKLTVFVQETHPGRLLLEDLLEQYAYHSKKFSFEFIDPDRKPGLAKSFNITAYGTILIQSGQNTERINEFTEEKITNAVIKATRKTKKAIYFLTGHGEADIESSERDGYATSKKAMEEKGYQVKTLLLLQEKSVPDDASILMVAGPRKALLEPEVESIRHYIGRGGKVFFMLDPAEAPGMDAILMHYGIVLGDDVIIDPMSRIFGADARIPVISQYQNHPITNGFKMASFFPLARTVDVEKQLPSGVTAQRLAMTGPNAWAEKDVKKALEGTVTQDSQKQRGPLSVAVVATVEAEAKQEKKDAQEQAGAAGSKSRARIVAFGDSDFANNAHIGLSGNNDLFLNTVSWLAEEENLISIRAKAPTGQPLLLTASQGRLLFWLSVVVLPLAVVSVGAVVLLRRRLKG